MTIYFDNGATTLQKPPQVARAMQDALNTCANPGRGGHRPAMKAAQAVYTCRTRAAELFNVASPERVVFTLNATHALNIAIKSELYDGGHVVISGYEHNSVVRPLEEMRSSGVSYTVAHSKPFDIDDALLQIERSINENTKCIIVNHISNVFGCVLPIDKINDLCVARGLSMIVDASQSAGILSIDAQKLSAASFICMPGHKSLYGPQGTGILICCKDKKLHSIIQGGTGSNSINITQPDFLPDIFESGTMNVCGIAGLGEGIAFVMRSRVSAMAEHKRKLVTLSAELISDIKGTEVYYGGGTHEALLSFTAKLPPSEIAVRLAERGVCIRDGIHCSQLSHKSAGTLPNGTCRISFSCFNSIAEVRTFSSILNNVLKN